ncbi:MAG: rhodanese-like domain-containing protein [Sulfitobacter sp.]
MPRNAVHRPKVSRLKMGQKHMLRFALVAMMSMFSTISLAQDTLLEAMDGYSGFAPYDAGIILPVQITDDLFDDFLFIDTRTAEEHAQSTIDGAIHIEWREVFSRVDEIPREQKTILFCNTGALSAQAGFGLRVLGYENVLILQGGFQDWQATH